MNRDLQERWYGNRGLLLWLETWLKEYRDYITKAFRIINIDLIPNRQFARAMTWYVSVFDVTILTHQMVSMVHENEKNVQSVFYLDTVDLIEILKRLENGMNQCRDKFDELITIDAIERMYVALAEINQDDGVIRAAERFETELDSLSRRGDSRSVESARSADGGALPVGVSAYIPDSDQAGLMTDILISRENVDQQLIEMATSLEILRAGSDREAVRDVNLESRLPPNEVRAIKLIAVPGDSAMARQICESYLAKLAETVDGVRTYRVNYGDLLSKWRGESEKNFERIMMWLVERARKNAADGRHFDVLWIDDVHALMSERGNSAGGEDYLNVIKTTMLQIMDKFNKDSRLSRFALLFSTGAGQRDIDAAFRRRIDNIYELKPLSGSPEFCKILVKHLLRATRLNVEGAALERLNGSTSASELQNTVYSYFVHVRFTIANEFNLAARGDENYTLLPLKSYYNLKGDTVRTSGSNDPIVQAVKDGEGSRYFYREGVVDGRNLSEEQAERTVFVLYDDPEFDSNDSSPPTRNSAAKRRAKLRKTKTPGSAKSPYSYEQKSFMQSFAEELRPGQVKLHGSPQAGANTAKQPTSEDKQYRQ